MGALRIEEMRLSGIGLVILSLGCLSALDESIEAGHDFNEVTKIPQTEVAEVVLPQTNLKEREVSDIELGTRAKIPWSPSPNVKEKNMKRDEAFQTFKIRREEWIKAKAEHKAKRERKRKAEKKEKEIKLKARARERKAKEHASKAKAEAAIKEHHQKAREKVDKTKEKNEKEKGAKEKKAKEIRAKGRAKEKKSKAEANEKKAKENRSKLAMEKKQKEQTAKELQAKERHRKAVARELHAKEQKAKAKKREAHAKEKHAKRIRNELTAKMNEMLHKHGNKEGKSKIKVKENKAKGIATQTKSVLHTIIRSVHHMTFKEVGAKHAKVAAHHVMKEGERKAKEQ